MKKTKIIIRAKSKSYPIYFGSNMLNSVGKLINKTLPGVKKIRIIKIIIYLIFLQKN